MYIHKKYASVEVLAYCNQLCRSLDNMNNRDFALTTSGTGVAVLYSIRQTVTSPRAFAGRCVLRGRDVMAAMAP